MMDLVKQTSVLNIKKFNDMNDFDINVKPGVIWDDLNTFNTDMLNEAFTIEKTEGKHIIMTLKATEEGEKNLKVKVKFFQIPDQDDENRLRIRFMR